MNGHKRRTLEWTLTSTRDFGNPFTEVELDARFAGPSGTEVCVPGFYDGKNRWRVRFSPGEAGRWTYRITSRPQESGLCAEGSFDVEDSASRGFLRATPERPYGLTYESGEPCFILGDTTYNLFGAAHCGYDILPFIKRRLSQGYNLLRARVPVSPCHPPMYSAWQTRSCWPWGGSEQSPALDRFNLDYFATVDRCVAACEELGMGLELIMEAWGFEFPFNDRGRFLPEWEELWMRYLLARYDSYNAVYFWDLQNEYEYYPDGRNYHKMVADRWAMRMARYVKKTGGHGHIVAVHQAPQLPSFGSRFALDPEAVDALMLQIWGTVGENNAWLATGIEDEINNPLGGWKGSAVLSEYGYERNPELPCVFEPYQWCDEAHTRRGAWRGAFSGYGVIAGFENTWGPLLVLDTDLPGVGQLTHLRRFFAEAVPFASMRPAPEMVTGSSTVPGHRPLALAGGGCVAVYVPAGGEFSLEIDVRQYSGAWFHPVDGTFEPLGGLSSPRIAVPPVADAKGRPLDRVLVLKKNGSG